MKGKFLRVLTVAVLLVFVSGATLPVLAEDTETTTRMGRV